MNEDISQSRSILSMEHFEVQPKVRYQDLIEPIFREEKNLFDLSKKSLPAAVPYLVLEAVELRAIQRVFRETLQNTSANILRVKSKRFFLAPAFCK